MTSGASVTGDLRRDDGSYGCCEHCRHDRSVTAHTTPCALECVSTGQRTPQSAPTSEAVESALLDEESPVYTAVAPRSTDA